jgi:predicted acetyltransferase
MCGLYLEFPSKKRQDDALAYLREFIESGSEINGMGWLDKIEDYNEWLKFVSDYHEGVNLREDHVRSSEYFLIRKKDDKIVGMVNIRHELNDYLNEHGYGHIGYGIRPDERRKGYAVIQLKLALEKCRQLGIKQVHVGCAEDNIGSKRTIEKNGGRLYKRGKSDGVVHLEYIIEN